MSAESIRVQTGPANYFSHVGAIERLADFFTDKQLTQAIWIHGERALDAARPFLPGIFEHPDAVRARFSGHCSEQRVQQLIAQAATDRQVVIGIGGGSVLDTAKVVARRLNLPFVAIPTIAATCAAWTPLSVWYNDAGEALRYEIFPDANYLLLVEPRILLTAPSEYLRAGIGDTLAKWYEAEILCESSSLLPLTVRISLQNAQFIRELLVSQGAKALEAASQQQLTQAFQEVIDAIIAGGGLIGGLGERFTRIAAAHAVHNGLTALPHTAQYLHGIKVAYGVLVQLALVQKEQELRRLIHVYRRLCLPVSLHALSVSPQDKSAVNAIIQRTLQEGESIWLMPDINAERLESAINHVEQIAGNTLDTAVSRVPANRDY